MNRYTPFLLLTGLLLAPLAALHAAESGSPITKGQRIYLVSVAEERGAGCQPACEPIILAGWQPAPRPATSFRNRNYLTGHSFYRGFPAILDEIVRSAGDANNTIVGVSSRGGAIVDRHYGGVNVMAALTAGTVDVLTTTPIYLPDPGIEKFAQFGFQHNPTFRLTVMEFWLPYDNYEPGNYKSGPERIAPPAKVDHNAATGESLEKIHRRYFDEMDAEVARINQKLGTPVVWVVPVGQAVIALREKIIAGQVPGLKKQWDLFSDNLGHPKMPLTILMGYCHYAVIYRKSPVGLPVPKGLAGAKPPAELIRLLQELAWNAVSHHPLSGVRADPSPAAK